MSKKESERTLDSIKTTFGAYFRFIFIVIFGYITTSWIFPDYLTSSSLATVTIGEIFSAIFAILWGWLMVKWLISFPDNKENYQEIWCNLGLLIIGLILFRYLMSLW